MMYIEWEGVCIEGNAIAHVEILLRFSLGLGTILNVAEVRINGFN